MPATLTYSPLVSQNLAEIIRVDTCDTRRWMMNPLSGICPTHRTSRGYRHASPHGDRLPSENEGYRSEAPQPTANYSLLTANWGSHLGSSSWITDTAGAAVQHLHYLPWGEDFVDQRTSSFSSMYTFSAKEKDTGTGYSYFGSRYYSSDLSVWLSVDPMAAKYPSLSPYTYCANNPVKLVDPNGDEVYDGGDPSLKRLERFLDFFEKKIRTPLMNMVEDGASVDELESAADYLSNKYQKKLLRGYKTVTGWDRMERVDIEVFSETEEIVNVKSRPDNQEMMVCGEIPLGPDVYAAEVNFAPYGIENNATFTARNKVETGWICSPDDNSFSYDLDVDGASSISYCIQNKLTDKRQDNWSFSVTLRSRRLVIRPIGRITGYRNHKKPVRKR